MRRSNIVTLAAPLAVALMVASGPARAEHGGGPCRQDIETYCKDVTPGPKNFHDCLEQNRGHLSSACQEQLSEMQAKMDAFEKACGDDVKTYCGEAGPGQHGIGRCLRDHKPQSDLSEACQKVLAQHRGHGHHGGWDGEPKGK